MLENRVLESDLFIQTKYSAGEWPGDNRRIGFEHFILGDAFGRKLAVVPALNFSHYS